MNEQVSSFVLFRTVRELILAISLPSILFFAPSLFENCIDSSGFFFEVRNDAVSMEWRSVELTKSGPYYVSVGRPQAGCDLFYGDKLLASNRGVGPSERSSLFLGASFFVNKNSFPVRLVCLRTLGSPVRLVHRPVVTNYLSAKLLHMVRYFSDQIIPVGLILLFVVLAASRRNRNFGFARDVLVLGLVTIIYLLSLANIPRLLVSNIEATYIHANLKFVFLLSVLAWQVNLVSLRSLFIFACVVLTGCLSISFCLNPALVFKVYSIYLHLFPIFILLVGVRGSSSLPRDQQKYIWISLAPILLTSGIDLVVLFYRPTGAFFAPVSTVSIFSLALLHRLRLQRAQNRAVRSTATWSLLQAEERPLAEKMHVIGDELAANTSLPRWSIYLDSFSLGYASRPRTELRRLVSSQQHEHAADPLIRLNGSAPFGALMRRALETDSVITERSLNDNCLYVVIPIFGLGCINLRGTEPSQGDERYLREYIDHIAQQLRLVVPAMVRADDPSTLAASLLREELGPGVHQVNYGAIFADAVGYTQNTHISPHFVEFFQFEYIPALLRSLGPSVLLKDVFGDELFLIVREPKLATPAVAGSLVSSSTVENLTLEAVKRLQQFVADEGRELCTAAGYQAIEFKVGSHAGPGQISILGPDVTIVGPSIEAKRCLGRSRPSQPFISKYLYIYLSESLKPHAIHEIYAAKKEILEGYRVSFVAA